MSQTFTATAGQTVLLTTFFVRNTLCALDATGIQEVIRVGRITPVAHADEEVVGIVNLRGKIVTILDLGLRLGFAKIVPGPDSRIFIIEDRNEFIGLLVDRVDEVVEVEPQDWQDPPPNISRAQVRFFQAIYRCQRGVISILDASQILAEGAQ